MKIVIKFVKNIFTGVNQTVSAVLGGDPDETVSSRIGKVKHNNGGKIPWSRPLLKIIDWLLERLDKGHTIRSIEDDEGKDEVVPWVRGDKDKQEK